MRATLATGIDDEATNGGSIIQPPLCPFLYVMALVAPNSKVPNKCFLPIDNPIKHASNPNPKPSSILSFLLSGL